ncbi:hypothetical protein JCM19314_872 [Nonlabens ulvanivorans]|uniref:Uncharacterized protein n=2 Tax=Nonlabens ulvanivorans TaxID=906888 RepID=A0A090QGS2_NONUL|nr:hypothetical protein JCM19314_872 [Nonlabens ulvanivorans]
MSFSDKTSKNLATKKYYVYVTTWSNVNGTSNGSDGVAYVTNVFTYKEYLGLNKSSIKIQFSDEFKVRYGSDKHYDFVTNGNTNVWAYDSYNEASKKRRAAMASYADEDVIIKQMNHFEYFSD